MADIPLKLYVYTNVPLGPSSYMVLPGTNTPYDTREVSLDQFNSLPQEYKDAINRQVKSYGYNDFASAYNQSSGYVDSYVDPFTGETLTNVPKSTINQIKQQQADLAAGKVIQIAPGLFVPVGSPGALLASDPTSYHKQYGGAPTNGGITTTTNGGSGTSFTGQFSQYVKTPDSQIVYGLDRSGKWVAFENPDQFLSSGGDWNAVQTVAQAPSGALAYSQAFTGGGTAPSTSTGYSSSLPSTGNPELDGILARLDQMIQQQTANGNKFNPNIELTPEVLKKFLDQAQTEIDPYYGNKIKAIKDDLYRNIDTLQKQYELQRQQGEADFQKSLGTTRENLAGSGLAFSGVRGQQEQALQQGAQRELDLSALTASKAAGNAISNVEENIGSRNLDFGTFNPLKTYAANTTGKGGFTSSGTTSPYNTRTITGDLEYTQRGDVRQLEDFLKQQEIQTRTLNF